MLTTLRMMNSSSQIPELMKRNLPVATQETIDTVAVTASTIDMKVYLVGGVVRDLLLGRDSTDLDIVIEGDAIELAYEFAETVGGSVTVHPRFRTATVRWVDTSIDLVTARSETYERPGALPKVKPGTIGDDLARRDFTVNAMAIDLSAEQYGLLIDPYQGCNDLNEKTIRILHDGSFTDDATRIWRAVRYEQRLGFAIERQTLELLEKDIDRLDTISHDRIRHELELVFGEALPEKALVRAGNLGIVRKIHPALKADDWLERKMAEARESGIPVSTELGLMLLLYRLDEQQVEEAGANLNLRKKQATGLREVATLKTLAGQLSESATAPSAVYALLHGYSRTALEAFSIAIDDRTIRDRITLYREKLSHVRTALTGADLEAMGISSGPRIKKILRRLLAARLDGTVTSRQDEIDLIPHEIHRS